MGLHERVVANYLEQTAAKGPKLPKMMHAHPHLLAEAEKLHGLNSNSSYLHGPRTALEEARTAVHKAQLKQPYETEVATGIKGMNYAPVWLVDYPPLAGKLTDDKESGEASFGFVAIMRDGRGREVKVPIEGMAFYMKWAGSGPEGKGILLVKRVSSHRPNLEAELEKLQKQFPGESGPLFGGH